MATVSPQFVIEGLMRRGYPSHVAQGFVMNMMDESGLNPGINEISPLVPGSRGGFGLYQLTGPRRTAYETFALQRGVDPSDAEAQLDFLDFELRGPESRAAKSILSTQNPQEAAAAIARDFLRPAPENLQKRLARYSGADVAADTMQALGKGKTMTPMAPTAAPQQERKGFLGGLLSDPDLMDRLAIGLSGMTMNPNVGLQQLAASRIASRAEERKAEKETNKTVEMLQRMGADPKLIELAQAGYAKEAIGLAYAKPKAPEFMEVNGKIVKIDPTTGAATEVFAGGPDAKAIAEARKEFTGLKPVKDFADQSVAYSRIIKSIEDPSPSGDLALIFNFMKVLDPGSVVREGEFATAQNAGSVDERVRGLYNRVISGERLTPEQRADFADRATRLYQGGLQEYGALSQQYSAFAKAAGLPVEQVIPSFGYSGPLYTKPLEFQRPPAPPGVPPAEWTAAWSAMTDEERAQFLNGGQP